MKKTSNAQKHEMAMEVFQEYELKLFFRLKEKGTVPAALVKKVVNEIEDAGLTKEYAQKFLNDQFVDMQQQIEEQRAVGT